MTSFFVLSSMTTPTLRLGEPFVDPIIGLRFSTISGFDAVEPSQTGVALDSCFDLPYEVRKNMKRIPVTGRPALGAFLSTTLLRSDELGGLRAWLDSHRIASVLILNARGVVALNACLKSWAGKVRVWACFNCACC